MRMNSYKHTKTYLKTLCDIIQQNKMPKHAVDYATTPISFYKFVCCDENITSSYVGHTASFRHRKSNHKTACKNENSLSHNYKIYQTIRANGGWSNWNMIEISNQICKSARDADRIEQVLIAELKADLNMIKSHRTNEERLEYQLLYDREHRAFKTIEKSAYQIEYHKKNKDILKQKRHERYMKSKQEKIELELKQEVADYEKLIKATQSLQ